MKTLAATASVVGVLAAGARADPYALTANALATTASPAGLVTVSTHADPTSNVSVEAVMWTGGGGDLIGDRPGDVLVMVMRARTADGLASGKLGRFVAMLGALRPIQIDGAAARVRLPHRFAIETYGGVPVIPDLAASRAWDWVVGGRISREVGDAGSIGLAYLQQRDYGRLASEEVGVDGGAALGKRDDLAAALAYDVANPGLAEARITATHRRGDLKTELFATYRAASHILPATSLFTVLGDIPAELVGVTATWRAAPRLDVVADLAIRHADGSPIDGPAVAQPLALSSATDPVAGSTAPEAFVRAKLRLDDRGASALGCELRRDGVGAAGWTGASGSARIALSSAFAASTELELVVPDHDRGLGAVWPWGLVALSYNRGGWQAAAAVEASASPSDRRRIDALVQLGRTWSTR
ncbi:MAG: hypothetical protein ABJE66_26865 [Deltaproteobacteria bacterium]